MQDIAGCRHIFLGSKNVSIYIGEGAFLLPE